MHASSKQRMLKLIEKIARCRRENRACGTAGSRDVERALAGISPPSGFGGEAEVTAAGPNPY
jgi:hypothetical protein